MGLVTYHQFCWNFMLHLGFAFDLGFPQRAGSSLLCLGFQERQFYLSGGFSEFVR